MRLALVGLDEDTKTVIAEHLRNHYGFAIEGLFRALSKPLADDMAAATEELEIAPVVWHNTIAQAMRSALGPEPFLLALASRLAADDAPDDIVVTDGYYESDLRTLQALGFLAIAVTSANTHTNVHEDPFAWHQSTNWFGAINNGGNLSHLHQQIFTLVSLVAETQGSASAGVRQGLQNYRG